ncbi:Disulfide bond formation protein D precursor [compost metagenome]
MSNKAWIIFAVVAIGLLTALVVVSGRGKVDVNSINTHSILSASEASGNIADQVYGKADSKVVLIEYGDFQCPTCGTTHPIIKSLTEKYKDQMAFVFRNFPLPTLHPNARAAAAAVEAAGLQGKYWDMHNKLFESQSAWGTLSAADRGNYFTDAAKELGLNIDTFNTDMAGVNVTKKISFDQALGKKDKVSGTPTVFLNGQTVELSILNDSAKLEELLKSEMKKQNIEVPAETK